MKLERKNIDKEIKAFRSRMGVPENTKVSVCNPSDVLKYAVYNAYRDMQPRTIKGHNITQTASLRKELAKWFIEFFKKNQPVDNDDFNGLHKKWCNDFLSKLNNKVPEEQEFGKAQKVINMAFKYLYCFDDAPQYEGHFKYCHMPIDSYTLNWCFENGLYKKKDIDNWSGITEAQYYPLSEKIESELGDETPLLAEFKIWPQEIAKVEEKELAKSILDYLSNNYDSYNSGGCDKLDNTLKRKIQKVNNDRELDGLKPLDLSKLHEMLKALISSPLFSKIEDFLDNGANI